MNNYREWLDLSWPEDEKSSSPFFLDLAKILGWQGSVNVALGNAIDLLRELGVNAGDYVILPNLCPVYWAEAVKAVGADALLIDAHPENWQLDLNMLEEFLMHYSILNERDELVLKKDARVIKAIIVPHLLGNVCDMDRLQFIARRFYLNIAEDISQALGSQWDDQAAGSFGKLSYCQFEQNPILPFGQAVILSREKGLINSKQEVASPLWALANYLGKQMLGKVPAIISHLQALEYQYRQRIKNDRIRWIRISPKCRTNGLSAAFLSDYPILDRDKMGRMPAPLHLQPPFDKWLYIRRENWAEKIHQQACLLVSDRTDTEIERLAQRLNG